MSQLVKYPRTFHLPWSPGATDDDKILDSTDHFKNKEIIVTLKLDGENTNLYSDYIHARSLDMDSHPSRDWIKNYWSKIKLDIPEGFRIVGENLYATHTIHYTNLENYFFVHSIWDNDLCLSYDDTVEYCKLLNLSIVPVLYRGMFDEELLKKLYKETFEGNQCEGYVVRNSGSFVYSEFKYNVAKYVGKKNFVNTDQHWKSKQIVPNELKEGIEIY